MPSHSRFPHISRNLCSAVRSRVVDGVATVTLSAPSRRNPLSTAALHELHVHLNDLHSCSGAEASRVVILEAEGPAFCAGHDLKEMRALQESSASSGPDAGACRDDAGLRELFAACSAVMRAIVESPLPVIAKVDGIATAAGCQLVASCDLAIASETSRFATPGVNIGLFCHTPAVALARNVGRKAAMEMLLTGELYDATHAQRIGLINRVVSSEALDAEVQSLAAQIASKSSAVVAYGKRTLNEQMGVANLEEAYEIAGEAMVQNAAGFDDAAEGIAAFTEKRSPAWTHR